MVQHLVRVLQLYGKQVYSLTHLIAANMDRDPLARLINETQSYMVNDNRLKIPTIMQSEGVHGYLDANATTFPAALALAGTFNTDLMEKVGDVIGTEAASLGLHNIFGAYLMMLIQSCSFYGSLISTCA